ncbi:hypothetical protein [Staphylococcus felis]|uniref:hypothetical protein n=1 Tax=Staphylococcus felis TaxID=46127 RepID=UPI0021D073A9|nr:hypothetical protein [Staphylococcus felis]UXR86960.1 hypothetical protein MUA17_01165 [Staphylococcus felis]
MTHQSKSLYLKSKYRKSLRLLYFVILIVTIGLLIYHAIQNGISYIWHDPALYVLFVLHVGLALFNIPINIANESNTPSPSLRLKWHILFSAIFSLTLVILIALSTTIFRALSIGTIVFIAWLIIAYSLYHLRMYIKR